jgi:hypothetical protein
MKKITYIIPLKVTASVPDEGKKIITMSFRAYKWGIEKSEYLLVRKTGVKAGKNMMRAFGKEIFDKVREMAKNDGIRED